ncbi:MULTISPECIES: acyl-CoA dehydrogenase family protein [Novosphingobium]|jgi:hypothetical protein|nr:MULTISPECIES: acyl-CoA dehydrogenase family protein [Novosphingobium]WJM25220.1 acyl-CoA dehydrogenase family protein [Novosphingobium resinovorum]
MLNETQIAIRDTVRDFTQRKIRLDGAIRKAPR